MSVSKSSQKKYKWAFDFNSNKSRLDKTNDLPGYDPSVIQVHTQQSKETDTTHLLNKKSWEIALGPFKQVPMNLFIMYMAGNSISIFPIMMVGMLFFRPIKTLFSLNSTFKGIDGGQVILQKIVFILGNLVNVSLSIYKFNSMGLLPNHSSDWLAFIEPPIRVEYSAGGLLYG